MRGDYKFEPTACWANVSEIARDFVKKCLTVDPSRRPTAAQLLEHKWLADVTPHFVANPASSNVEADPMGGGKSQNDLIGNLRREENPNNLLESVDDAEMELPDDFSLSPIPRVSGIPVTTLAGRPDQDLGGASRQGYADATTDVHEDQLALAASVSLIENGYSGTVVEQVKHGKASETRDKWGIEMSGKVKLRTVRKNVVTARTRRGLRSDDLVAKDKSTADDNKTGRRRRGTQNRA
jgi:serine/threonine protein kinase